MKAAAVRSSARATLVVAPPLAVLLWLSGQVSVVAAVVALVLLAYIVFSAGFVILRVARCAEMPAPAAWVLGIFATALALNALVFAFDLLAATAFAIWALAVVVAQVALQRSTPARSLERVELIALVACGVATLFWCWNLAEVPKILWRDGILTTWVDQFIHGSVISQLGDPRADVRQHMELADYARLRYHYASYTLPAVFAWPLDLPGLTLAASLWVPLGFLTACAGTYTLGAALAGEAGGFAALGALTLLPDAASYGLHNRLYGYYWYVLAVPTASYSVGAALVALALLRQWSAAAHARGLVASAAMVAGSAFVRVHNFAVLAPAWLMCTALTVRVIRRHALGFAGAGLALFGLFVWGFYEVFPDAQHALGVFLDVAHLDQVPVAYRGLYGGLMFFYGPAVAVPVGVLLVLAATVGIFGILYPVSVVLLRRVRPLEVIDLAPLALLVTYVMLILTAPIPLHGDSTEFTQRPFVLVYAAFGVWTAAGFAAWIARQGSLRERRLWLPLLVAAALTVLWVLHSTVRDWRWAYQYRVAEGLPQAADYIRSRSKLGDVLATSGLSTALVTTDLPVQLASMTGVPAYLARPFMHMANGGARAAAALPRYIALRAVERETDAERALARLRSLGIRWYVVAERDRRGPAWDPQRRRAVFVDRMVSVYALR